jgi:hypothetical protein
MHGSEWEGRSVTTFSTPNWVGTAQQELEKTRIENVRLYYYKYFGME